MTLHLTVRLPYYALWLKLNVTLHAGTLPYEVSQRPLPSGAHIFTVTRNVTGVANMSGLAGAAQFFLPRKFISPYQLTCPHQLGF